MTDRNGLTLTRFRVVELDEFRELRTGDAAVVEDMESGVTLARCFRVDVAELVAMALDESPLSRPACDAMMAAAPKGRAAVVLLAGAALAAADSRDPNPLQLPPGHSVCSSVYGAPPGISFTPESLAEPPPFPEPSEPGVARLAADLAAAMIQAGQDRLALAAEAKWRDTVVAARVARDGADAKVRESRGAILDLRSEVNCRHEHGADGAAHLRYVEGKLSEIVRKIDGAK